jgi:ATP-dependent DNA helicase RecQ
MAPRDPRRDSLPESRREDPLTRTAAERFGLDYIFPYQRLVISNTLDACGYFGPEAAECAPRFQMVLLPGLTVVIFPLLSLMADQQRRLLRDGISCALLAGGLRREERRGLSRRLSDGRVKVLLTNPESLLTEYGRRLLAGRRVDHLVFDEVHTVCEWGESFRPAYLEVGGIVKRLAPEVLTAFTATASSEFARKAAAVLMPGTHPHIVRANPDRPNITYSVIPSIMKMHDLAALLQRHDPTEFAPIASKKSLGVSFSDHSAKAGPTAVPRPALIFCRSRKSAELTAAGLRRRLGEEEIFFYHAGLEKPEKKSIEEWFFTSQNGILAATTAYGMGVDKADIRTVIHRELSPSVEAYLQESGRAGRDGGRSRALVLLGPEELRRATRLGGSREGQRFRALLSACRATAGCRREHILALLGSEPEACFGCDLCAGALQRSAYGERAILELIRRRPLRYTEKRVVRVLIGARDHRSSLPDIPSAAFFGALADCEAEDLEEALLKLRSAGFVKVPKRGPWRGLLQISSTGRARLRSTNLLYREASAA